MNSGKYKHDRDKCSTFIILSGLILNCFDFVKAISKSFIQISGSITHIYFITNMCVEQ